MAKTYTFNLSLQGVTTDWGYVNNYNFNQAYTYACAGFEKNSSNKYRNFGGMLYGNISVVGTPSAMTLTVNCRSTSYPKTMKLAKKTGSGATNYGFTNLTNTQEVPKNATSFSINVLSYGICQYGYFIYQADYNGYSNPDYFTSATLTVTTNATDYSYTLAYNANGGSGAPGNQTGSNTRTSPSYTFTISSTKPTRAGYDFLGWSTSSTATTASYQPSGSITVTSSGTTTLYAVWKVSNTVRIVNGSSLDRYTVYIVENNALVKYKVCIVNTAGTGLDAYS